VSAQQAKHGQARKVTEMYEYSLIMEKFDF